MFTRVRPISPKWLLPVIALAALLIAGPPPVPASDLIPDSPTGLIRSQAFSPEYGLLAVGGNRGIALLDAGTLETIWFSPADSTVVNLAFSHGWPNLYLASAHSDGSVMLWDAVTGDPLRQLSAPDNQNPFPPVRVAFSASGNFLASAGSASGLQVWDIRPGTPDPSITPLDLPVSAGAFVWSPSGATLAVQDGHNRFAVLDVAASPPQILFDQAEGLIGRLQGWSPDGRWIVFFQDWDKGIAVWDAADYTRVYTIPVERGYDAFNTALSQDGRWLARSYMKDTWGIYPAPSPEGLITLWDLDSGRAAQPVVDSGHAAVAVAFSPDGRRLVSTGEDGTITVWDMASLQPLRRISVPEENAGSGYMTLSWVDSGRLLVFPRLGGALTLWDVDGGTLLRGLEEDRNWQRTTGSRAAIENDWGYGVWSPDGRYYAAVGVEAPNHVVDTVQGRSMSITAIVNWNSFGGWSADSRYAVFYAENQYGFQEGIVFDTVQWEIALTVHDNFGACMSAMSPCPAGTVEELLARVGAVPAPTQGPTATPP